LSQNRVGGLDANRPKMLCCHDMRGGYLEDRFQLGRGTPHEYVFRHWHVIDGFVYFSHRMVTIPPANWINAAHRHGVPVLGTLITEWEQGTVACEELLSSDTKMQRAAHQLATLAQVYNFEGWVINIENELRREVVERLLVFVEWLTIAMHKAVAGSKVIWYDAVTIEGKLEWQNALNKHNKPFFDVCDGIWINYTWKEGDPGRIRDVAGERAWDVYLGVDCFGRGTYGGGGLHTHIAVDVARNAGLNVALFACGWPFEYFAKRNEEKQQSQVANEAVLTAIYESWYELDEVFWDRIQKSWKGKREVVTCLPFYSNFSIGSGSGYFSEGVLTADECPWYNLNEQKIQCTPWVYDFQNAKSIAVFVSDTAAYNGSNCLMAMGGLSEPFRIKMFPSLVPLHGHKGIGIRCSSAISKGTELRIAIKVSRETKKDERETVLLEFICGSGTEACSRPNHKDLSGTFASTVSIKQPSKLLQSSRFTHYGFVSNELSDSSLKNCYWRTTEFGLTAADVPSWVFDQGIITNIDAILRPATQGSVCRCHVAIGDLSVWFLDRPPMPCMPVGQIFPEDIVLLPTRDEKGIITGKTVSLNIVWENRLPYHEFQIMMKRGERKGDDSKVNFQDSVFLGIATAPIFQISQLRLELEVIAIRIYVSTMSFGRIQDIRTAECITLTFPESENVTVESGK